MIGILLNGRLGNQMFEYAVALNYARKYNTSFFVHQKLWDYPFFLTKYFQLPSYSRYINSIRTRLYNAVLNKKFKYIDLNAALEKAENIIPLIQNNTYLDGYFQSEYFFAENKYKIIKEFSIKKDIKEEFDLKYNELFLNNKVISVHIRRTDYVEFGGEVFGGKNLTLPVKFYFNCLEKISNPDNYKILFVSDDIEYAKQIFGVKPNYLFEQNNEITDFQLLMNADINIIANSSFSWWAAYLNPKPGKIVYAPEYWLGFKVNKELPPDTIPKDWIKVAVK
jgi:hypothetical protein